MKIFIIDNNRNKVTSLKKRFTNCSNIECVCSEFIDFMNSNQVECIVSPANSFGLMDGGYDKAISEYFGNQLQKRVQQYIINHYYGEQPVGCSFIIRAGKNGQSLIHTPSMRTPGPIKDPLVIYQCMRSTLMCAYKNHVRSILIPVFGGGYGNIHSDLAVELMWKAYIQIKHPPKQLNWQYVNEHKLSY